MFEKERSIDVSEWGYEEPVVVKRLNGGEKRRLDDELARVNNVRMVGKEIVADVRPGTATLISAAAYIKSAPFPSNIPTLEALDWELIELIAEEGRAINPDFRGRTENGSKSRSEQPTPGGGHPTLL
jgi:hypothetical protein